MVETIHAVHCIVGLVWLGSDLSRQNGHKVNLEKVADDQHETNQNTTLQNREKNNQKLSSSEWTCLSGRIGREYDLVDHEAQVRSEYDVEHEQIDLQVFVRLLDHIAHVVVLGDQLGNMLGLGVDTPVTENGVVKVGFGLVEAHVNGSTQQVMVAKSSQIDDERDPEPDHMNQTPADVDAHL